MTNNPSDILEAQNFQQSDFEKITQLVITEFQVEESLMDQGVPTYYLKWPQETKQAFLRLLNKLGGMSLIAFLRKADGRTVLRVVGKPPVKPSNPITYWILFFATVATTFVTVRSTPSSRACRSRRRRFGAPTTDEWTSATDAEL